MPILIERQSKICKYTIYIVFETYFSLILLTQFCGHPLTKISSTNIDLELKDE